ncbi:hypothetical protein MKZ38_008051 [Zalerion maritima]|uniref:RNA 3'-terminal phosphate cyclase domain-containing protein n=1 Tax=Zalerion maritima TaxID=339359 RepID=A0AAD5RHE8_9PEZI|nr:hypothetical protein MKZ38_008051 [Zalerion maritima]
MLDLFYLVQFPPSVFTFASNYFGTGDLWRNRQLLSGSLVGAAVCALTFVPRKSSHLETLISTKAQTSASPTTPRSPLTRHNAGTRNHTRDKSPTLPAMAPKPLTLDGRTGEGGGQLVRLCAALCSVTSTPFIITNVRGNRAGGARGGGLKAQHVSGLSFLAKATGATVSGLHVGSKTVEFHPQLPPISFDWEGSEKSSEAGESGESRQSRNGATKLRIEANTPAASAMLIFQAIFPYLLFASTPSNNPIQLELLGGTNVSWSLSWEYFDQVLLPTLEVWYNIRVARSLVRRGWSTGTPSQRGIIHISFTPIPRGQTLTMHSPTPFAEDDFKISQIDVSIITPTHLHTPLQTELSSLLSLSFPSASISFPTIEDSGHDSRVYILLVAVSQSSRMRWGRDILSSDSSKKRKVKPEKLAAVVSGRVCQALEKDVALQGACDEFLQDQLIVFQCLASGRSSFPRSDGAEDGESASQDPCRMRSLKPISARMNEEEGEPREVSAKKVLEPFGQGSMHSRTARWVASEVLGGKVGWFNDGSIIKGAGISFPGTEGKENGGKE